MQTWQMTNITKEDALKISVAHVCKMSNATSLLNLINTETLI